MPFKLGAEIPKGHVKLPEPLTSDYLIPTLARAKSLTLDCFKDLTGWSFSNSGSGYSYALETVNYICTNGLKIYKVVSSGFLYAGSISAKKSYNIPADGTLVFHYKATASNASPTIKILIDGTEVKTLSLTSEWTEVTLDITSGTHTFEIQISHPQVSSTSAHSIYFHITGIAFYRTPPSNAIDNDTSTVWIPTSSEPGEWIYIDLGSPTIVGGIRIYWGDNVPNKFTVEVSTDATNWTPVYKQTSPPTPNGWQEIGFYATYARYIRIYIEEQGTSPAEIAEIHYYSSLVERVAAEHGHGSGPEPWRRGSNVRLRYVSKFANIQARISSLQEDLQKSRTVKVKHVQELTAIVQDLKELVKLLHI